MKKKMLILVLALTAIVGAAVASNKQGSTTQENASNYWVVRHWYRTYSVAPVYVYRPRYVVAAPVYTYPVVPVYRFHIYHYYFWRY